jgi:carnitine 3-dehydrogenase
VTAARHVTPLEGVPARSWDPSAPIDAPLRLYACVVRPEWVDYNGHLSEWSYLLVFGDNSDAFFRYFGIDEAYRAGGYSLYTVETHLTNLREVGLGAPLQLTLRVLDVDGKRVRVFHEMFHDGELLATAEQMLLHVDTHAGRVAPLPPTVRHRLEAIRTAHACLPIPPQVGRAVGGGRGVRA